MSGDASTNTAQLSTIAIGLSALAGGMLAAQLATMAASAIVLLIMDSAPTNPSRIVVIAVWSILEVTLCGGIGLLAGRRSRVPITFVVGPAFLGVVSAALWMASLLPGDLGESVSLLPSALGYSAMAVVFSLARRRLRTTGRAATSA